ncbi:MAG: TadE/TadG family type IV pilus assembly protein, partial [Parvularculaceae bacterium]
LTLDFGRAERGNIAVLSGLAFIPILISAGVAIDFARAAQVHAAVQEAADGALLRVARLKTLSPAMSDSDLTDFARRVVDAATEKFSNIAISSFAVSYNSATEIFSLDIDAAMPTSLMRVAGVDTVPINAVAEVKLGKPPYLEVVMALDNTGSMATNDKIGSLKSSANALVDSLFDHPGAEAKVGLVPFAQYVNVGVASSAQSWMGATTAAWAGCVGSRNYPLNTEDAGYATNLIPGLDGVPCPQEIMPMTNDKDAVKNAINTMTADGFTYIPSGLAWGWRALSDQAPFSEGVTKEVLEEKNGMKALILLTDGENTRAPTYPDHESTDSTLADTLTTQLCEAVKADGIVLYTIAFDISDALIRDLLEDCGTTPGHYFEPTTATELAEAFDEIATSLRNLSLSK